MIKTLSTAATGLQAQQANIERISNDLANSNTDGYKSNRIEFEDLMYRTLKEPGTELGARSQTPVGIQEGTGVKVGASYKIFDQGPARMTYDMHHVMIEGPGFLPVTTPNGEVAYTRNGAFHRDAQGRLTKTDGSLLEPQITVPPNATNLMINQRGEVSATVAGSNAPVTLGQLELFRFQNEQGLMAKGSGLFLPSPASGPAVGGIPGENGFGTIQQGALEASNVNVPNAMVEMIQTQRTYELGTKVMSTADEMMNATIGMKK